VQRRCTELRASTKRPDGGGSAFNRGSRDSAALGDPNDSGKVGDAVHGAVCERIQCDGWQGIAHCHQATLSA